MAKYTLVNDPNYILFSGIVGSKYENEQFAFRKSSIKQVRTTASIGMIHLVHLDDTDSPFKHTDLIDPGTGNAFVSLEACKATLLLWLNELAENVDIFLAGWDADLNLPLLADDGYWDANDIGVANVKALPRAYLIVTVAGTTLIDGVSEWEVGDYIKSTGYSWVRIPKSIAVSATNVFFDNVDITDPAWSSVDNVQVGINLLESTAVKELKELSDVDDSLTPEDLSVFTFDAGDGRWKAIVAAGGRTLVKALAILDGTDNILPAYGNGLYVIGVGITAGWVPAGAEVGDIVDRVELAFTIETPMASESGGAFEVQYSEGKFANTNYVWDGTNWAAIDAYEPNPALSTVNVSNPIGDITSALTGADLKDKSISSLLDDILFETVYTAPLVPTLTLSGTSSVERGLTLSETAVVAYNQRGGGEVLTYKIEFIYNLVVQDTIEGVGPTVPNVSLAGKLVPPITGQTSQVRYTVVYDDGPIPIDNKGVSYPGDQILSGTLITTSTWTARYPIYWDVLPITYGVATEDLTDLSVTPILTEADLKTLGHEVLFTANATKTDTIDIGDITVLAALPPGITMSNSELNVAGSWLDYSDLRTHSITVPVTAADGTTSRNYTVYYTRSTAANSYTISQDYRFTTTGSVIA